VRLGPASSDSARCRIAGAERFGLRGKAHGSLCDKEAIGFPDRPSKAARVLRAASRRHSEYAVLLSLTERQRKHCTHRLSPRFCAFRLVSRVRSRQRSIVVRSARKARVDKGVAAYC